MSFVRTYNGINASTITAATVNMASATAANVRNTFQTDDAEDLNRFLKEKSFMIHTHKVGSRKN
jgi:hypothetical protein